MHSYTTHAPSGAKAENNLMAKQKEDLMAPQSYKNLVEWKIKGTFGSHSVFIG